MAEKPKQPEPEEPKRKGLDLENPDPVYEYSAKSNRTTYGANPLGEWFVVKELSDLPSLAAAGFEIKRRKK
jgi:hypothetical protein